MTSPEPPTSDQPPPAPRLARSSTDRQIAGVAGGIARHFDLDPSLVRIAFVVLGLFGGFGLAIYAVCAFVVPSDPDAPPLSRGAKVALGVVGVAALIAFPFAGFFVGPGLGGLVVLGALGVVAWRVFGGSPDSRLLKASLIVLAVLGSVALGLGAGVAAAFGAGTAMAIVAIVAGAGLVVGGFLGGGRWLILPALVLVLPVSVVSAADLELEGGVGDREYRPVSVTELRSEYRLGAGELRLDLRDLALEPGQQVGVDVRIGVGAVRVEVPDGACVIAEAHAGLGDVDLLGRRNEGVDVDNVRGGVPSPDAATLTLDLHAGVGEIVVDRDGLDDDGCG